MHSPRVSPSRTSSFRALAVGWAAVVVLASTLAGCSPEPAPSPAAPSSPTVVAVADRVPLAPDGAIDEAGLVHDSRSDAYRVPFGAVPAGTKVTLRLRAVAGDLTEAVVRVWDDVQQLQALVPMAIVASDRTTGDHGYDFWQAVISTSKQPTVLYYRFIVRDGPTTRYVEDDPKTASGGGPAEGSDGGAGRVYRESVDASWQIDVYQPDFTTPAWAHGAVVYQIFPDRFADGDPTNNPTPTATQGPSGAAEFRYGDVYGNAVLVKSWTDRPEGYCRAYQGVPCTEGPLVATSSAATSPGITGHLDDLKAPGRHRAVPQPDLRGARRTTATTRARLRVRSTRTSAPSRTSRRS